MISMCIIGIVLSRLYNEISLLWHIYLFLCFYMLNRSGWFAGQEYSAALWHATSTHLQTFESLPWWQPSYHLGEPLPAVSSFAKESIEIRTSSTHIDGMCAHAWNDCTSWPSRGFWVGHRQTTTNHDTRAVDIFVPIVIRRLMGCMMLEQKMQCNREGASCQLWAWTAWNHDFGFQALVNRTWIRTLALRRTSLCDRGVAWSNLRFLWGIWDAKIGLIKWNMWQWGLEVPDAMSIISGNRKDQTLWFYTALNRAFNLRQLHWQQFWGSAPYTHWTLQGITSPCNRSRLECGVMPRGFSCFLWDLFFKASWFLPTKPVQHKGAACCSGNCRWDLKLLGKIVSWWVGHSKDFKDIGKLATWLPLWSPV